MKEQSEQLWTSIADAFEKNESKKSNYLSK